MSDDEPLQMTLDLQDGSSLKVIWSPADEIWFWSIFTSRGQLIQSGMNLQIAHGHTAKDAMRVLVQYLSMAVDHRVSDFYDQTHVWAATRRQAFQSALSSL